MTRKRTLLLHLLAVAASALLALLSAPARAESSIEPMNDASRVYPRIARLINDAQQYVHVAIWGFDDELRLSATGETPVLLSRQSPSLAPPNSRESPVENLHCDLNDAKNLQATPDPESSIVLLRCKATDLALRGEAAAATPTDKDKARSEVMVLVWNNLFDDLFNAGLQKAATNVDDLAYLWVRRTDLLNSWIAAGPRLHDELRTRGSGESMEVLNELQRLYGRLLQNTTQRPRPEYLPMPTGIYVLSASNFAPNFPFGSHHQKLLATERGAYVGGLNFLKEYWDTPEHDPSSSGHFTSGGLAAIENLQPSKWQSNFLQQLRLNFAAGFEYPSIDRTYLGTLHDTGSIIRGDLLLGVNDLFSQRWQSAFYSGPLTGAALASVNTSLADSLVSRLTAYGRLKEVLVGLFPKDRKNPDLIAIESYLDQLSSGLQVSAASTASTSTADPDFAVTHERLTVSAPLGSYFPNGGADQIRKEYEKAISTLAGRPSSFFYLENQFFQDHDFFKRLFAACATKKGPDDGWCDRAAYGVALLPYAPQGLGIPGVDDLAKQSIVKDEMQNLAWLEVKTAHRVLDRETGAPLIQGTTPPPAGPCACPAVQPYVHFKKKAEDADPAKVSVDSVVEMMGDVGLPTMVTCNTNPPTQQACPTQPAKPLTAKLKNIITDGSFMSYVVVTSTPQPPLRTAPSDPLKSYDNFLAQWTIYIHSKHSEFLGSEPTFVLGSANLNPRSLSHLGKPAGAGDAPDSEDAVFWTPKNLSFAGTLWREHMGPVSGDQDPVPPGNFRDWADEGWTNWTTIRGGGSPPPTQRVVRLDVVQRCLHSNPYCR